MNSYLKFQAFPRFVPVRHKRFIGCILSCIILVSTGCKRNDKVPAIFLSEDSIRPILTDVLIAESAVLDKQLPADSFKIWAQKYYLAVFAKHHITREKFFQSMKYYNDHPDKLSRSLGPIIDSLNAMEGGTHKGQ